MSTESPPRDEPPGVRAQFGATKDAAWRLAMSHVDLAKAEAAAIGSRLAQAAALMGLAFALLFLTGILLVVGSTLFVGEWLFGSLGWGVIHGTLAWTGLALAAVFAAVGLPGRAIGAAAIGALLIAVILGVILGLELGQRLWTLIGDSLLPGVEPGIRPLVVGLAVGAIVGLLAGLGMAIRAESGGARAAIVIGMVVLGALAGAISATTLGLRVGIALGITAGLGAWLVLLGVAMARHGLDTDALKARFYPTQTIETSKETLEWLKTRLPPGIGS